MKVRTALARLGRMVRAALSRSRPEPRPSVLDVIARAKKDVALEEQERTLDALEALDCSKHEPGYSS